MIAFKFEFQATRQLYQRKCFSVRAFPANLLRFQPKAMLVLGSNVRIGVLSCMYMLELSFVQHIPIP